jgi:hypothetical protein
VSPSSSVQENRTAEIQKKRLAGWLASMYLVQRLDLDTHEQVYCSFYCEAAQSFPQAERHGTKKKLYATSTRHGPWSKDRRRRRRRRVLDVRLDATAGTSLALQAATATEVEFWEDGRALMTMSLHRMQAKRLEVHDDYKSYWLLAAAQTRSAIVT